MIVKAELKFTFLNNPDDNNKYSTAFFCLNKKEEQALIELIENAWETEKGAFNGKPRSLSYREYENPEDAQDPNNGKIIFNAAQNAESPDGQYKFKVDIYDSDAQLIDDDKLPSIGWGTIANLSVSTYVWTYKKDKGVKLNLDAVQILDLVEFTGSNPFEATDEGSFKAPSNPFKQNAPKVDGI